MKKAIGILIVAFAFSMAAAVAQTSTDPSQGTSGTSPSTDQSTTTSQQPTTPSQPPSGQVQTDPAAGQPASDAGTADKANSTLRGCVQSQAGQYLLESKKGKAVALTGQDVSAHVGHEVSLKGSWQTGSAGTDVSTASGAASEKTFNVVSVEMISDSCGGKTRKGNSGDMGASPDSAAPGTGSTTNPPQQ